MNIALVCHLQKALYSLKRVLYVYYGLISEFLQCLEFTKIDTDHSIFVSYNKSMFISIHIDELLIIGKDLNIINSFKNRLFDYFCMIYLILIFYYLGISITWTYKSLYVDSKNYLEKILFLISKLKTPYYYLTWKICRLIRIYCLV